MRNLSVQSIILAITVLFITSCKDKSVGPLGPDVEIIEDQVALNPTLAAPLSALIELETSAAVSVDIRVFGKNGSDSDITQSFQEHSVRHQIPVLGLYPNYQNTVELTFYDRDGSQLGSKEYEISTGPQLADMPTIEIDKAETDRMAEGLTFVSYFGHSPSSEVTPQKPFMFDTNGDIRWYLDFRNNAELSGLFYDNGMERLQNGNLYFGNGNKIYEIDMLGNIINSWGMPGYSFHHEVTEKPNGNFLVTVNKNGAATVEDHVIEIDHNSGNIITVWDLNESLDNSRTAWDTDLADITVDWFHANAVEYVPKDNTILVSGRTQGLVKLNANNEVIWILAPHKEWGRSGNGTELNQFLLQPLNSNNEAIADSAVIRGEESHPNFEWSWYQHAPQAMPNGNVLLFDNGDNRNYTGTNLYSRAVEYEVDETSMTIRQAWSYGKSRGVETYSRIVSDVDYFPDEDHVFFSPGASSGNERYGKVVEIDRSQGTVLFEATITPPVAAFGLITFHRTERMPIYPN